MMKDNAKTGFVWSNRPSKLSIWKLQDHNWNFLKQFQWGISRNFPRNDHIRRLDGAHINRRPLVQPIADGMNFTDEYGQENYGHFTNTTISKTFER